MLGAAARKLAKAYAAALATGPVSPSQFYLLRQLWRNDGLQLRDLAARAQLDATSTTWLVDQLEKGGLIERRRIDADRRVVRVFLTDPGLEIRYRIEEAIDQTDAMAIGLMQSRLASFNFAALEDALKAIVEGVSEGEDFWADKSSALDSALKSLKESLESDNDSK